MKPLFLTDSDQAFEIKTVKFSVKTVKNREKKTIEPNNIC